MKSLVMIVSTVVLMAGGTSFVGCNKNTPDPKEQVSAALKSANIQDVDVDYDKDVRVVHLKGTVDSPIERARAEEVAERAVGTSGKILNEVTVKGVDAKTADTTMDVSRLSSRTRSIRMSISRIETSVSTSTTAPSKYKAGSCL